MIKKNYKIVLPVLLVLGAIIAYVGYTKIYQSNVVENAELFIKKDTDWNTFSQQIQPFLKNETTFQLLAAKMKFSKPKAGRYLLKKGMSNITLIRKLRAGMQDPLKLSFNNQDTLEKLAGRLGQQLEPDSLAFLKVLTDEKFLTDNGFDLQNAISLYIPNSYELYWTISPEKFRDRMLKEYKSYWNNTRIGLAKEQNLTPLQVSALASIVQKETASESERPIVAGLYLNRLNNNILLQADPTVIFAVRQVKGQDFEMKRVLLKDLETASPYNTYLHEGLPPGPIAMADISSIEAVLHPQKHDYLYMCASVTDFGKHVFAETLEQHNVNAAKYQKWVAQQGY